MAQISDPLVAAFDPDGPLDPAQVVLPSIFDAYAQPDVLLPLVLANLLSPELWELSAAVAQRAASGAAPTPGDLPPALREAQDEIDRHFEHLTPVSTAGLFGELDLDAESERLGADLVARAVRGIAAGLQWRLDRGQIDPAVVAAVSAMIAQRRFPAYHYATFDVVRANRRMLRKRRHAPLGLTSCLDETAIFSALAMTLPAGVVDDVVVLGSPEHYTAFGWNDAGGPWWFYAKNCLLSAQEWRALVADKHGGGIQAAFDLRFRQFDRIVTIDGTFDFSSGHCEIPVAQLGVIAGMLDRFFGIRTTQLDAALNGPVVHRPPSHFAALFADLLAVASPATVRERILGRSGPSRDDVLELVRYADRSLAVADLEPYLAAARRSPACVKLGRACASVAQALALVRGIEGRESIFGDRERIAMPEETLRLQTGSDRDLALLLHVLLESMPAPGGLRGGVETWLGVDDSFVTGPDFCISLRQMALVDSAALPWVGGRRLAPR